MLYAIFAGKAIFSILIRKINLSPGGYISP